MPSIRLKNIGPLTDTGVVEMKKVTLFIGAQSTGKSTLMKILCFCCWLEKHIMAGDDKATLYNYTHYNRFLRELKQFHRFNDGYFNADSEIDYRGSLLDITLHGTKNARITKHADFDQLRCNAKLCFIPSERNLISALRNADRAYKASNIDMLFNYVFEWAETRGMFTTDKPMPLSFDQDIEYYYDAKREKDILRLRGQGGKEIEPFYASSGVQSALPIEVMVGYVTRQVGQAADVSQQWLMDFVRSHMVPADHSPATPRSSNLPRDILTYQYANLFVEEPEQNLFPQSQWELLCQIVAAVNTAPAPHAPHGNAIVLTTHSPYILSALNILAKASVAMQKDPARTQATVPAPAILPIGDIAAYHITGGQALSLIDEELGMINGNALDAVSDDIEEKTCILNEIIYG